MGTFAIEDDPQIDDVYFMDDGILSDPTDDLTLWPTFNPSKQPTKLPVTLSPLSPTKEPSPNPTLKPTELSSNIPSQLPSRPDTLFPTLPPVSPTDAPSLSPPSSLRPTTRASKHLSSVPSHVLSFKPSPSPSSLEPSTQPVNTGTKTYFSCAAPAPEILEGIDYDGNTVLVQLGQPVSTVPIGFIYEVTTKDNSSSVSLADVLPEIQSELGDSLAGYLKSQSHSEDDDEDGTACEGYNVDTLIRRLQDTDQGDGTKIISIASSSTFAIDSDKTCTSSNPNCSVVEGSYDVTYIGTNEAAVKSSIVRAMMMEEVNLESNSFEAEVSFVQEEDHSVLPPVIQIMAEDFMDSIPESDGFGSNLTIYGKTILGLLVALLLVIIFVVFRSDSKGSSGTVSYDLENVVIDDNSLDCEQPIQLEDGSKSPDSATTPKVSNKAPSSSVDLEGSDPILGGELEESESVSGLRSQTYGMVDRTPSRLRSILHNHPISMADSSDSDSISELPSILEDGLPPLLHDTSPRKRKTGYFSSEVSVEIDLITGFGVVDEG